MRDKSLADMAVSTLAAIERMDADIDNDDPERHAIRMMKNAAENMVMQALNSAMQITWTVKSIRDAVKEAAESGKEGGMA